MDTRALDVTLTQRAAERERAEHTMANAISALAAAKRAVTSASAAVGSATQNQRHHNLPRHAMTSCAIARHAIERGGLAMAVQDAIAALNQANTLVGHRETEVAKAKSALEQASRDEEIVKRAIERAHAKDMVAKRRRLDDGDE